MKTADATTLSGSWVGGYGIPGGWRFMLLNLDLAPTGVLEPRVDVLFEGETRLDDLRLTHKHVSFTLARGMETLRFEGERNAETIVGFVSSADWRGTAVLLRTRALNDSRPYRGTYQLADGRLVAIFALEGFYIPGQLAMAEFPSGEVRLLFPTAEGSLVAGPGFFVPLPAERRFEFTHLDDRGFERVHMRGADAFEIEGKRLRLREEEIRFRSGDVTLVGNLVLPRGDGPHPAVVIAHGSGDAVRDDPFAYVLAQRGLAFFRYDKRGVGASGGDWHTASFEVLADDVVAALRCLGERADIDSSRLGIWGWSQGGWIAPLAAVRASNVAFLVLQVPPAVSPAEQEIDRVEHELGVDGFSQLEIDEAVEFMRRKAAYARSGQGWVDFAPLLERSAETAWFPYAGSPMKPDSWGWTFFRLINDYDPIPVLERVHCPVLALFGELDQNVVPAINVPPLEAGLRRAGNRQLTVKVFPNASHGLLECREGGPKELPLMRRYAPGYIDTLLNWLDATATLRTR
jgi:alpha-beta hydrolase superfamily lysophospholipase